jgi:hypothetical protein
LIEPAALASDRVTYHGAAMLSGAQPTIWLPLELNAVGAAVALDGGSVIGAERLSEGCTNLVIVVAGEQPAFSLETLDQLGG